MVRSVGGRSRRRAVMDPDLERRKCLAVLGGAILWPHARRVQPGERVLTRPVPIAFAGVGDPVASGLVTSLNRPGGNATGTTNLFFSLGGKWLELLNEIVSEQVRAGNQPWDGKVHGPC